MIGHLGVRLFFVLSGFLITRILLSVRDNPEFSLRRGMITFYARRFLRIFPAYYLLLIVSFGLGAVDDPGSWEWFVTYLSNFHYAERGSWNPWVLGHSWTLAIEEQFYAVWPFLIFLVPRHRLAIMCLVAIAVSVFFRFYFPITAEPNLARDLLPPASIDALAAGSLLAIRRIDASETFTGWTRRAVWITSGAFCLLFLSTDGADRARWAIWLALETLPLIGFCFIIGASVNGIRGPAGRFLSWSPIRFVGRISYGIYLYHFIVLWGALALSNNWAAIEENGPMRLALCGSATILVASMSWFAFEKPLNGLKRYFPYQRPVRTTACSATKSDEQVNRTKAG